MKLENRFTVPVPRDEAWKVLLDVERITPCLPGAKLLTHDGDDFTGQVKVKLGPINLTYSGKASFVDLDEAGGVAVIDAQGKETRGTGTAKAKITCRLIDKGDSTDIEVDTDLAITGKPAQFGRGVLADVSAKLVDQFAACLSDEIREGTPSAPPAAQPETAAAPAATTAALPTAASTSAGTAASTADDSPLPVGPPATSGIDMAIAEDLAAGDAAQVQDTPVAPAPPAAAQATAPQPAGTPVTPRAPRQQAEAIDLLGTAGMPVAKRLAPVLAVLAVLALVVRALRR